MFHPLLGTGKQNCSILEFTLEKRVSTNMKHESNTKEKFRIVMTIMEDTKESATMEKGLEQGGRLLLNPAIGEGLVRA